MSGMLRNLDRLLARLAGGLAALAIGLLAVSVFTVFAVVAGLLAVLAVGRLWWLQRFGARPRPRSRREVEAEYTVSPPPSGAAREPDAILPPERKRR